ncbi:MAG: MarR family transcriptional regulator [bacterium]
MNTSKDLLNGSYGSKPNMAKKLKTLEEHGFIKRKIDIQDKRIFRFTATKKAQQSIKKVGPIYEKNIALIFDGINNKDLNTAFTVTMTCLQNLANK